MSPVEKVVGCQVQNERKYLTFFKDLGWNLGYGSVQAFESKEKKKKLKLLNRSKIGGHF